jgi:hypothetical protein
MAQDALFAALAAYLPASPGGWVGGWEKRAGVMRALAARQPLKSRQVFRIGDEAAASVHADA